MRHGFCVRALCHVEDAHRSAPYDPLAASPRRPTSWRLPRARLVIRLAPQRLLVALQQQEHIVVPVGLRVHGSGHPLFITGRHERAMREQHRHDRLTPTSRA